MGNYYCVLPFLDPLKKIEDNYDEISPRLESGTKHSL